MEPDKELCHCFFLFSSKEKYCWCTQNYLWDVW